MLIDQNVPHALLNHTLPPHHGTPRNAGNRQVPGRPPLLLLQTGRRVVLGLLLLGIGIAGPHVLGPATERVPLGTISRSCEGMQHTLHPSHALAWSRMLRISLATPAALHLLPPPLFFVTPLHAPFHHHFLTCNFPSMAPQACLLRCLDRCRCGSLAPVCTCLHCQHLSALE